MKRLLLVGGLALFFSGFALSPLRAAVQVGDKPALAYKAVDGSAVSLEALHGKIVVVDFWATWCKPCMAEAAHMVEVNQKYAPKGLQMLGISLDSDQQSMLKVAAAKGFAWPQYFDGLGWENKIFKTWGEGGIPFTVLLGPDGSILWKGHPGGIDGALADAFKNHPPQLVEPTVLAAANASADKAEAALKEGDAKSAIRTLAAIPNAALLDGAFAKRSEDMQKQLTEYADKALAEVDPLIEQKQYTQAIPKLKEIAGSLGTLPSAVKARQKLAELMKIPDAKAQMDAAEKADRAEQALAVAQKLKDAGKNELAYARFKDVAAAFAGTPAAATAGEEVKNYEKDPAFIKKANGSADESKAKSILNMATSYKNAGRSDLARKKFQEVVDQFPNTPFADTAKKELATLP